MSRRAKPTNAKRSKVKPEARRTQATPAPGRADRRAAGPKVTSGRDQLEERLAEALEQLAATSEILRVISSSATDVQPVFDAIARAATALCGAENAGVFLFDGRLIHFAAHHHWTAKDLEAIHRSFPRPPGPDSLTARAILTRAIAHSADIAADSDYKVGPLVAAGFRAVLSVPMLRDGEPIGAINVTRREPIPFSDAQVALLETFARQAVIAIHSVRLFTEVQARNRELTEALEQQTATGEILRVISRSPTDIQPVLDAVTESAARLCETPDVVIFRRHDDEMHLAAHHGPIPVQSTVPLVRGTSNGRAVLDGRTIHIADMKAEAADYPEGSVNAERMGHRTILCVPLMREGRAIGTIQLRRTDVHLFSERQVALLETFADQAVIAIENVRLFTELGARNRELTAALDQQTATGQILRAISSSPTDVQPVFVTIAESAVRLCEAEVATVTRFDGEWVHLGAIHGSSSAGVEALRDTFPMRPSGAGGAARAVRDRDIVHIPDVLADEEYAIQNTAVTAGFRAVLGAPMMREGRAIGAITLGRTRAGAFTDAQAHLLRTFADQAVIAVENVRLFTELETRNRELTATLEQQTATGEILRAISSSPTDVRPVFETIARSAARLCESDRCFVFRYDGRLIHFEAHHGLTGDDALAVVERDWPAEPNRGSAAGRAVIDRGVAHIPDFHEDAEYALGAVAAAANFRSMVAVPMLREGLPIGVVSVLRARPGRFTDRQIALLQTFADQAVIAVENVRLFTELETRNHDLVESLEQQTATGEILRVISRSPTDVQPVFDTIAKSARRLCTADSGAVYTYDGALVHLDALDNTNAEQARVLHDLYPAPASRGHATGRAIMTGMPAHIPDVSQDGEYTMEALRDTVGLRSLLSVPMIRDGSAIGAISLQRWGTPRPFSETQIALLQTFADQAVIAVENVRLFTELEARNRDLKDSLEQQTATSELLKVIGRSTFDLQPVFETLVEHAVQLCDTERALIFRFDGQVLRLVAAHNATAAVRAFLDANPITPGRHSAAARAALDRRTIHIHDILADPDYSYGATQVDPFRTVLAIPMLRADELLGVILIYRHEVRPFTDSQVALMETFADQASIAIENARLVNELQERTSQLTRSVHELRALGEVSQAVSSTLEPETVLATIVSRAVQLSGSHSGVVYEFDEASETFHPRVTHRVNAGQVEAVRTAPIRLGEGVMGRAGVIRQPVQVTDLQTDLHLVAPQVQSFMVAEGMRSLLAIPLIREERLLGGLVILRREAGAFSPETIATLQTFAAQSVLAIQNARLFREVQRQKQYADALVETTPVAITTVDAQGRVVGWNPGAVRLFGYSEAEAMGRPMDELVAAPEGREEVRANVDRILAGERINAIARRARKDGTPVDVEVSSMPLVVDGAEVGFIAIYHDITELVRARREAEAANEAKSAFLATMSHEIRTPMNAVIGMSGLLLNTALTDEQREYAEVVRQSGDALLNVINDILDFSKIEAGKLELESRPFDLRECVEGVLDLVATRAAEKGLDLAYLIGDGTPAAVVGDVTRLRQILLNLLSNAVKFTERGEVVLSVSARRAEERAPHELTFSVRDTGIGIPPDRLGRLFHSFSQVDASTTRRYGGTGLGLAISQRLTELMGGRIEVSSEIGVGSEFRFAIRALAAEAPVPTRRDLMGVQPSLRDKRVLVVDDNATNRRILASHLEGWGMSARATEFPLEALRWVRDGERFDLGILDMHMPELDGVSLAAAMREHAAGAALPLILFTSLGRREARAEEAGFAAYLNKPIKPSQLFDALATVLADQPIRVARPGGGARIELDPEMARRHPLRILLAEDNVVNQKVALRLLAQMGYRADLAANGIEAVDAVERQMYDVVLMDVQMPELDGFEASREINRRWPDERRPRIVAMTANAMQGDRELCAAAGMDDYVAKPIRVEDLIAALGRSHPRQAPPDRGRAPAGAPPIGAARAPDETRMASGIDRAVVEGLAASMGGAFVAELIGTFVEDARELVVAIRRALGADDLDGFRRAAHSLKSTSESLGAIGLASRARELESLARAGSLDGAAPRLEPLAAEYEAVARLLEEIRHGLPS